MQHFFSLVLAAAFFMCSQAALAEPSSDVEALQEENAVLKERLQKLEGEVQELKRLMEALPKAQTLPTPEAEAKGSVKERLAEIRTAQEKEDGDFPLSLYGFLKMDVFGTEGRVNNTDFPRFAVLDDDAGEESDTFTATIQHSRVGAKYEGPKLRGVDVSALVEFDLFNLGDVPEALAPNNNELRVRRLFLALDYNDFRFLAGQEWDLFSPLNPTILNTNGNMWFGGNAGFRRPQLRAEQFFPFAGGSKLKTALSLNANVGTTVVGDRRVESGEDSGLPVVQGRIAYSLPLFTEKPAEFGIAGAWGREEVDGVTSGAEQLAASFDAFIPLAEWATFKGELQWGRNSDVFQLGGGVNPDSSLVTAASGWGQFLFSPWEMWTFAAMFGMEQRSELPEDTSTFDRNLQYGATVKYEPFDNIVFGLEYTHFDTNYPGGDDANADMWWFSTVLTY
jgi:predicted house-cleaning noncanonical NTP pyrophosphatase (MazG superfamily)